MNHVIIQYTYLYARGFYQGGGTGVPEKAMPRLIREATGVDASDFIARYAEGREDIPLQAMLAQQGIKLEWQAASKLPSLDVRTRSAHGETQLATVFEGGAAHRAGLCAGDIVVAVNGLRVPENGLDRLLQAYRPGDTITIHVFRRDELRAFEAILAEPEKTECTLAPVMA